MKISPQIRYAVERALQRARLQSELADEEMQRQGILNLQSVAWADECDSLEEAVEILKGLEA